MWSVTKPQVVFSERKKKPPKLFWMIQVIIKLIEQFLTNLNPPVLTISCSPIIFRNMSFTLTISMQLNIYSLFIVVNPTMTLLLIVIECENDNPSRTLWSNRTTRTSISSLESDWTKLWFGMALSWPSFIKFFFNFIMCML